MKEKSESYQVITGRQKEILELLVEGLNNKQIARKLNVSIKTINAHRANIKTRLKIDNLAGLVKYAIRIGITEIDK